MILFIAFAYALGIIGGLYKSVFVIVSFCIVLILVLYFNKKIRRYLICIFKVNYIILFIVFLIFGLIHINIVENNYQNYIKEIKTKTQIKCTVVSDKEEKDYVVTYKVKYKNKYLMLNVKKSNNIELNYGDIIIIQGEIIIPEDAHNYGGFSYKEYLKTKNIYATINLENIKKIGKENLIGEQFSKISNSVENKINSLLNKEQASVLIGIVLGNKDNMPEDIEESFKNSNLSHLLAVSGAHVSYIILGIVYVTNKLNKKYANIFLIIILIFFCNLVGNTPSVLRACIMAIYILIGKLIYKKQDIYNSLGISLLLILLSNPYSFFNLGLQLSFGGTIGIICFSKPLKNRFKGGKIIDILIVSLSANIVILPLTAYHLNTISITFFVSNILASPILGIVIILGAVTILISYIIMPVAEVLSYILNFFINTLILIANFCSKIPLSKIYVTTPSIITILIYYFVIIFAKSKLNNLKKYLRKHIKIIVIILIIVMIFNFLNIKLSGFTIYFIDVSQGDSTLIKTCTGKTLLIDGGGNENYDVGKNVLVPYLLDRKIKKIDYCIISHFDTDHVGGILTVMQILDVKNVIIGKQFEICDNYKEFIEIAKDKKIKVIVVEAGQRINIEKDLYIDILWPSSNNIITENNLNNNSLVCKMIYKETSILFTGDIEEIAEKAILEKYKNTNMLSSTILKVAHHGSKSSSIEEFINKVKPKIVLIGVGKNNTFGHPNEGVLERLKQQNSKILRTDLKGEIILKLK